ncbi:MAG: hypothetical protein WKF30_00030 [Pyrinomonadaceae bacterium]
MCFAWGRAAGDATARYRVSFEGPFIAAAAPRATSGGEEDKAATNVAAPDLRPGTRRVNSVGARIEDPEPPKAAPENTTAAAAAPLNEGGLAVGTASPAGSSSTTKAPARATPPAAPPRPRLPQRAAICRAHAPPPRVADCRRPPRLMAREQLRKHRGRGWMLCEPPPAPPTVSATAKVQTPVIGVRLVIEMRDGERIERAMSEVRRFTVERGVLIIVASDGRAERRLMSGVLKVAIE